MAHWHGTVVRKVLHPWLRERPLHNRAADRVRPVENNDLCASFRGGFQKVAEAGFICVETHSGILQVDDHSIELFQHVNRWTPSLIRSAVDAVDRNSPCCVTSVPNMCRIQITCDAVLRTENSRQLYAGSAGKHIDCAMAGGVDSRLIRQDADALALERSKVLLLEDINPGEHSAIAVSNVRLTGQGFVVAGNSFPAQRLLFWRGKRNRSSDGSCNFRSQGNNRTVPASRVDCIRKQDDVSASCGIDPQRRSGKPRVPK